MAESTERVVGNGATDTYKGDIVVGVDGSDESFAALKWALIEAGKTGQKVNAVFAWTHSWDMGGEPDSDEEWAQMRHDISESLRQWVDQASDGIDFNPEDLKLTSVKASGSTALLHIGADSAQIVVGRRSLGRVARWFLGSLSSSLAEEAKVPVTVVHPGSEPATTNAEDDIAAALNPDASSMKNVDAEHMLDERHRLPVVVGIDGSTTSKRALDFAIDEAKINERPLQVLFCWQMKDLGKLPGYETTVPSVKEGQAHAERVVRDAVAKANIPDGMDVQAHAFHIPAGKGLVSASRYANRIVVGSRGLSGLDAHFLGSVSKQVVDNAECTVTVVH
ncbi:universal stress protein [Bifidobacterium margollesii]|uniref:Universal stress protein n=1 Tax=Bifidobacterium margollesii TaxID=2020964 RepID=A0A2N5J7H6_9BIFI|nr:universal stress protein [Bifidobacterium margollesii]PLS30152.1 universal stress protein [Bifidobacterium margollesii]